MSIFGRISNLFSRSGLDREIESELESHIEMRIEDNVARGMSPEDAGDALARFGNPAATKEHIVFADAAVVFGSIWDDTRYAFRQLRKSPALQPLLYLPWPSASAPISQFFSCSMECSLRICPLSSRRNFTPCTQCHRRSMASGSFLFLLTGVSGRLRRKMRLYLPAQGLA